MVIRVTISEIGRGQRSEGWITVKYSITRSKCKLVQHMLMNLNAC